MNNDQTTTETQNQQGFGPGKGRGFGGPFGKMFAARAAGQFSGKGPRGKAAGHFGNRKAANIEENEAEFKISLYAAGLVKSNFKISVSNDVLNITYNAPQSEETDKSKYAHLEYVPTSFERSFQLNGKVLTDSLSAAYTDGVLVVTLPKNAEANKPAQQVNVG